MMRFPPSLLLLLLLVTSCDSLQDVALYDVVQEEKDPWVAFEYAEIFSDSQATRVFGLKDVPCRSFRAVPFSRRQRSPSTAASFRLVQSTPATSAASA